MKLFKKVLAGVAVAAALATSAQASVLAVSDFAITGLGLLNFSLNPSPYTTLTVLSETRNGSADAAFNGVQAAGFTQSNFSIGGSVDSPVVCVGSGCAGSGLTNNSASHITAPNGNFAYSDMFISGNAFGAGVPSGMTKAGVSISGPTNAGNANSTIKNDLNILNTFTANVSSTVFAFVRYDLFMKTWVDTLVGAETAVSNASIVWSLSVFDEVDGINVFSWTPTDLNRAISSNGKNQLNKEISEADTLFGSAFNLIGGHDYTVSINQKSEATARDIPEPESLALVGLGLLGLAASRRRKAVK